MSYAELHCHSGFSLGDGASTPEALAARAAALGLPALALTDHDDLGGAVRFTKACREAGVQPVLGAELTLEDDSHLTLLVEDEAGWRNLSALITRGRMEGARGQSRVSWAALESRTGGLVALSGCPRGRLPRLLQQEQYGAARDLAARLHELFPGRFYLELWDHRTHAEASLTADLLDLAREFALPWVVTNDVHYAEASARAVHDLRVATRLHLTLEEAGRRGLLRPSAEWCLKSPEEMLDRWRSRPEGVRRTVEVAERCRFTLEGLRPRLPTFPVPPPFREPVEYLAHLAHEGLARRLGEEMTERHGRQLEHELSVIGDLGMAEPFLIVWDLCRFARDAGVLCQGRGSAANSIVCYALEVTAVDPIRHDLLFERFVSRERPELPDIDIDFPAGDTRERVLQYVYERYGRAYAAMVCTHVEYLGRSAVRDAMRALDYPLDAADALAKRVDGYARPGMVADWLGRDEGAVLRQVGIEPGEPRAKALVRLVEGLERIPRQRGIHPGGFVLSRDPIGEVVPVEPAAMEGRTVMQWDKDDCEELGILKFDLLGLGMLQLLSDCVAYVQEGRGAAVDLGRLPEEEAVYAQIRDADTVGLFQIESRAQANFLPRLRPRTFYDLVISVGAIRPGPMLGGQVREMLARRRGEAPLEYPHPDLEPVLHRTYGLALFQEQLMRCAIVVSGCSPGEADRLRRAMSKKRSREEMDRATSAIREGMARRGVESEAAERVLGWLGASASYTFPESHAISFALLAYASAWLRHHYPAEYLSACLNAQPMGFYSVSTLVADARAHGVEVRPVDLACSRWDCTLEAGPEGPAVRMGVRFVRGLGKRAGERLRAAMEEGPFRSPREVVRRSGMGDAELRCLAAAGAFRSWFPNPREALWVVLGELRALRTGGPLAPMPRRRVELPEPNEIEATLEAYRTLAYDPEGHPMRHLRGYLDSLGVRSIARLKEEGRNGERTLAAGMVIVRQRPGTAKGFVFMGLEDETARLDVIISPDLYDRERLTINGHGILAVQGRLGREDEVVNLKAERFFPLRLQDESMVVPAHDYH